MQITVKTTELRPVFETLSTIFKMSEEYRAVHFEYVRGHLRIAVTTSCHYEASIPATSDSTDTVEASVIFKDILDILVGDTTVFEITELFVTVSTSIMSVTFEKSNEIIQYHNIQLDDPIPLVTEEVHNCLSTLLNTSFLRKAYKNTPLITLHEDRGIVKFPTVWIMYLSTMFTGNYTQEDITIISRFKPTGYSETDTKLILYNGYATLSVARTLPSENNFAQIAQSCKLVSSFTAEDVLSRLRAVYKIAGDGTVVISFSADGFKMKLHRVGMSSEIYIGESSNYKATIHLPLEFFVGVLGIIKGIVKIGYGGDKICLVADRIHILMSTSG